MEAQFLLDLGRERNMCMIINPHGTPTNFAFTEGFLVKEVGNFPHKVSSSRM